MKTARTIRTLRRTNTNPKSVGFAGYTPTGKRVRTYAKRDKAMKRLAVLAGTKAFQLFTRGGISEIQSIKMLTTYINSSPEVQAAWLK